MRISSVLTAVRNPLCDVRTGRPWRISLPSLLLALIAACLVVPAAGAVERVTVQLNWKHQFESAAFYAAVSRGFYRDARLEVVVREGGPGVDAVKEVVAGNADFGVGTSSLVVERYRGHPVVALASLMQHSPIALLALRRNGVNSVQDLADRPVAVDPHSRDEIHAYLLAAGLQAQDIRLVDQTDWTLASLDSGREAAKVVYTSNEPFHIRNREHEYLLLRPQSAGIDLFGNILFTTQGNVAARPAVVEAFRDATVKGLNYALDHADEIATLIIAAYNTQAKSKEHLLFEARQIRELARPDIVEAGYMSPSRWRHVVAVLAGEGELPADFDLGGFIYEGGPAVPRWLVVALVGTLLGLLGATLVVLRFQQLNRRLKLEIADREQADQALRHSREALVSAQAMARMGGWTADLVAGTFTSTAEGARLMGWSQELHSTADVLAAVHPDDRERVRAAWQAALASGNYDIEHRIATADDEVRWLHVKAAIVMDRDGRPATATGMTQDVTETRRAQLALQEHQARLEETVAERTSELVAARNEAQRLARTKSEFLANMSHEIRTPLNAVLGFAQIGVHDSTERPTRAAFARIRDAGEHLLGVINDVLDISKLEAGKVRTETRPFQLTHVVVNASNLVAGAAAEKGLAYRVDQSPDVGDWVMGDAQRVQQILVNLLTNAVKFTERGEVRLRATREGDLITLEVIDTGIGMTAEQMQRLFRPFEQADSSSTRRFGGSGLGLAISNNLAALMGGEIRAASTAGKGSAFTLRLPLPATTAAPSKPCAHAAGNRLAGVRVLAAEDAEGNRLVLEHMLELEGAHVTFAEDGRQALDRLQERGADAYDVVLMDIQMPRMDGYEATRRIRSLAPELPVIGLTAHALLEERRRCLDAGMVEHLSKPVDLEDLVTAIRTHIGARVAATSTVDA